MGQVEKPVLYYGFRAGGIAYGPRFRGIDVGIGRTTVGKGWSLNDVSFTISAGCESDDIPPLSLFGSHL